MRDYNAGRHSSVPKRRSGTVACRADPTAHYALASCHVDPASGRVRFSMIAPAGVTGVATIGTVTFAGAEGPGMVAPTLAFENITAANPEGTALPIQHSRVDLTKQLYLPLIVRP